jgi:hypothetical protein
MNSPSIAYPRVRGTIFREIRSGWIERMSKSWYPPVVTRWKKFSWADCELHCQPSFPITDFPIINEPNSRKFPEKERFGLGKPSLRLGLITNCLRLIVTLQSAKAHWDILMLIPECDFQFWEFDMFCLAHLEKSTIRCSWNQASDVASQNEIMNNIIWWSIAIINLWWFRLFTDSMMEVSYESRTHIHESKLFIGNRSFWQYLDGLLIHLLQGIGMVESFQWFP